MKRATGDTYRKHKINCVAYDGFWRTIAATPDWYPIATIETATLGEGMAEARKQIDAYITADFLGMEYPATEQQSLEAEVMGF